MIQGPIMGLIKGGGKELRLTAHVPVAMMASGDPFSKGAATSSQGYHS